MADERPTPQAPLEFLVEDEPIGYCNAETGICAAPAAEVVSTTGPESGSPER